MLKDIFTETRGRTKIKIANTTGDSIAEVAEKIPMNKEDLKSWLRREEAGTGWKLENESFSTVLRLAEVLHVSIDKLLTPDNARKYQWHEQQYPPITPMEETRKKSCDYMTPQQLADHLGVTAKTVIRLIKRGEIVAIHLGHRYLIQVTEAANYINSKQTTKTEKGQ
jgi:excisionase family DNA binding protein